MLADSMGLPMALPAAAVDGERFVVPVRREGDAMAVDGKAAFGDAIAPRHQRIAGELVRIRAAAGYFQREIAGTHQGEGLAAAMPCEAGQPSTHPGQDLDAKAGIVQAQYVHRITLRSGNAMR